MKLQGEIMKLFTAAITVKEKSGNTQAIPKLRYDDHVSLRFPPLFQDSAGAQAWIIERKLTHLLGVVDMTIDNIEQSKHEGYPCEMEHNGMIVKFTAPKVGTVIRENESHRYGEWGEDWDMSVFSFLTTRSNFPCGPCQLPLICSKCGTLITSENEVMQECGTGSCPNCGEHWHCGGCV